MEKACLTHQHLTHANTYFCSHKVAAIYTCRWAQACTTQLIRHEHWRNAEQNRKCFRKSSERNNRQSMKAPLPRCLYGAVVCVCVSGMCTYSTLHATVLVERTTHIHTHSLSRSARAMFSRIVSATHTHTQPCMHCDCDCARRRENPYHTCVLYYACVCTWRIRLSSSMLPFLLLPIVHVFSLSVTVDEVGSNQPARGSSKFQSLIPKTRHIYIIALHRCSHIVCVSRSIRVVIHRGIDRQSVAFTP